MTKKRYGGMIGGGIISLAGGIVAIAIAHNLGGVILVIAGCFILAMTFQYVEKERADLLEACKAQHQAIDRLFAELVKCDPDFFPSKSGQPWEACKKGNAVIKRMEG